MNALISQQGTHDDFARGHAVAPAKAQEIDRLQGLRMELAMLKAYRAERKARREADEKRREAKAKQRGRGLPTGLNHADASRAARKISAQLQRDRSQAEIYNILLDHGPLTTDGISQFTPVTKTTIRLYLPPLVEAGMIENKRAKHASRGQLMNVWHVVAAQ